MKILKFFSPTVEILCDLFKYRNTSIPRYQDTNRCRGYAHITFDSLNGVKNALKLHKKNMGNRYVEVT